MTKINLEIENCKGCPFFEATRYCTADTWETAFNWYCKHPTTMKDGHETDEYSKGKKIAGYVEWMDEKHIKVPDWCPIKEND